MQANFMRGTVSYEAPYQGYKVVDLSQGIAGPYCGMLLALYGADVVKVEPLNGDWARTLGSTYGPHSATSIAYNLGKRSVAVDLKNAEGFDIVKRLAARCDILIESYRPGVTARLGLGYEEVRRENPKVLYVSISGFGQTGPYAEFPCSDTVAQAFSGLMSVNIGNDGTPHKVGLTLVDVVTGMYAFQSLATALFVRERDGQGIETGRYLDISLIQSAAVLQGAKILEYQLENGAPKLLNAPAGSYRTNDGWITISLVREEEFGRFCVAIGHEELVRDTRFASFALRAENIEALVEIFSQSIVQKTTEEWMKEFGNLKLLCTRINDYGDWLGDPHIQSTGAAEQILQAGVGNIPMPIMPGRLDSKGADSSHAAPGIGEHSRKILEELGFSNADIVTLGSKRAVRL